MITSIGLLKSYWKPLAIALLALILYAYVQAIKSQRDSALQTIADMQLEAIKKNAEVALLNLQGKKATEAKEASHVKDIQHIGSLYGKVINDDKKAINNYRIALADKLREQSKDSDSNLPGDVGNQPAGDDSNAASIRLDEESPEFYKSAYLGAREYISTLEQAGAVAAADYNMCKSYVDQEQQRIGVYGE